jgi:hypothetical protein
MPSYPTDAIFGITLSSGETVPFFRSDYAEGEAHAFGPIGVVYNFSFLGGKFYAIREMAYHAHPAGIKIMSQWVEC